MTGPRLKAAEQIFNDVVELTGVARAEAVQGACGDDAELREFVERLLAIEDTRVAGFMASAPFDAESAQDESDPARIGRYEILHRIGEGGMGVVYEAMQDAPQRRVAIKVVRAGYTSKEMLRRFRQEADVLAQLQHPGIAHIYEAGVGDVTSKSGLSSQQPFFAMEFIRGRPLLQFAEDQQLSLEDRLELIARVCDAVQHAHQKGVIHRDLKPANILVVADSGDERSSLLGATEPATTPFRRSGSRTADHSLSAQPKILDFGVARVTGNDLQTMSIQTGVGQLVGTIPYMSPEQIVGDPRAIDTRSDVYAIGVILYELLAGKLPIDVKNSSIPEAARRIREEEPSRLSIVNKTLRGDIETIVRKAMEKERDRRYQTAAEVAADIRRYLSDEPIQARPASAIYQFRKYARRNPMLVTLFGCLILALAAGFVTSTRMYYLAEERRGLAETASKDADRRRREAESARDETRKARDRAEASARRANTINQFVLSDMLRSADPNRLGMNVKMVDVLDRAASDVSTRFASDPELEGAVRTSIGMTYNGLGLYAAAKVQLEHALALLTRTVGPDDSQTLATTRALTTALRGTGDLPRCEKLLRDGLARSRALNPPQPLVVDGMAAAYGETLQILGKHKGARIVLREAIDDLRGNDNDETVELLTASLNSLAASYTAEKQFDDALPNYEEAMAINSRALGAEHPTTIVIESNVANCLLAMNRLDDAIQHAQHAMQIADRVFPANHTARATVAMVYGAALFKLKRFAEAEAALLESYRGLQAGFGDGRYEVEVCANLLRDLARAVNDQAKEERWARIGLELRLRVAGPGNGETVTAFNALAEFQERLGTLGKEAEARALLDSLLTDADNLLPPGDKTRARYLANIGRIFFMAGDFDKAEPTLKRAFDELKNSANPPDDRTLIVVPLLDLYRISRRTDDYAKWKPELRVKIKEESSSQPASNPTE